MSTCLRGWRAQAGAMAEPQVPRPGKWFAWAAVLAGLLPSLWVAGTASVLGSIAFAGSDGTNFIRGALIQASADGGVSTMS